MLMPAEKYGVLDWKEYFFSSYLCSENDLQGKSWYQLVTLDNFFLDWEVRKTFVLLTHFKTVNYFLKLLLGQGAQARSVSQQL